MNNFNLKKFIIENRLLKEDNLETKSAGKTLFAAFKKEGLKPNYFSNDSDVRKMSKSGELNNMVHIEPKEEEVEISVIPKNQDKVQATIESAGFEISNTEDNVGDFKLTVFTIPVGELNEGFWSPQKATYPNQNKKQVNIPGFKKDGEDKKPMSDEELEDLETRIDDHFSEPVKENTAYLDGIEVDYSNIDLYSDIDQSWSSMDIMEADLMDWFKASVASMGEEGGEEIIQSIRNLNNAMVQHLKTLNEAKDEDWIQKGEKSGEIKAGGLHKALGIPEDEKIPVGRINKELAKLKKKDDDKGEKGVQGLSAADRKLQKQLNLAKSFKKMDENIDNALKSFRINEAKSLNEAPDIMDLSAEDLMSARFGYKHGLSGGDLSDLKKIINKFITQANRMRRPRLGPDELGDVFGKIVSNFL